MRSGRRRPVAHVFQIRNVMCLDGGSVCTIHVTGVRKTSLACHALCCARVFDYLDEIPTTNARRTDVNASIT